MPDSPARTTTRKRSRTRTPPPVRTGEQAESHRRTRQAHSSEIAEDYVEAIADLIDSGGEARVVDLARCLGVTHVTVVRTIARLQRRRLVSARPYRSIFLTDAGRAMARRVRERHRTVYDFLRSIGVGDATARSDSEGIEHHVSDETLAAFARHVKRAGAARRGTRAAATPDQRVSEDPGPEVEAPISTRRNS